MGRETPRPPRPLLHHVLQLVSLVHCLYSCPGVPQYFKLAPSHPGFLPPPPAGPSTPRKSANTVGGARCGDARAAQHTTCSTAADLVESQRLVGIELHARPAVTAAEEEGGESRRQLLSATQGSGRTGGGGTGHRQHQHKRRQVAPPPQLASTQAAGAPAPPEALLVQCQHALAISQAPHLRGHSSATQLVPGAAAPTGREAFLSWRLSTHPPRFLRQNQQHRWHCYPLPSLLLHHNTPSGSYPGPLMRPCSGAGMW